ncbi:similar to Saccharomyces cerevisiae YPR125W YLH47 Mitochondrial inner membrane protein exposed to the mitochondrial matrix [Maudiozyma saulgeensis]|uniref:Similar to Saccharomyces cerevisiae YPR125W YLH47 Mitochondrial inner membrane protein exposed to the mitochondrial matrix n=1 Tax=Maudiozyma saulgeensis TaxID=1789683 RepID=A0A1X7QXJ5_9SACH|nr:similar to Saccharomyces cerevisiae YPR125W YLH47 Mitochondrial inner membrane protein exposed to the mitochondrial matrix [Kazachstania saulgeensis]
MLKFRSQILLKRGTKLEYGTPWGTHKFLGLNSTGYNNVKLPLSYQSIRLNSTKQDNSKSVIAKPKVKKPLWTVIKEGASHYWDGTKLLGFEIKISSRLLMKMSSGKTLTRREMIQLKRTTQDVVRLVPFAAFVLIPFAELLLPLALKIFPNLLPSTYESTQSKETKLASLRKTRELVTSIIKDNKSHFKPQGITEEQKILFNRFYKHVRATGESESRSQLIEVARLFSDDTVLDNLSRPHLIALAKYINIQPFGTDVMLRYRIRFKLLDLKKDDFALYYEDAEQLNSNELRSACASRGIRIKDTSDATLRKNLKLWLNMRIKDKIPSTLMVLATSYNYGDASSKKSLYDSLCDVLSAIPDELYHEVKVNVVKEDDATAKQKLEHLKEQDEIMKEEVEQEEGSIVKVKDSLSLDAIDKVQEEATESVKSILAKDKELKGKKSSK